jgi:hypothetical protein
MSSHLSCVLNKTLPYMDTEVLYERTKAEIEILKKFRIEGVYHG